jgi:regulatory protein
MSDNRQYQKARDAALRLLTHRPRSEAEVRTRLAQRFPDDIIDRVVSALREQSFLNDDEFARLWTESRNNHHPRSAAAIRRELESKGVSREIAEEAVADVDDADGAYRAAAKFSRRLSGAEFQSFHRRLWGHLQRRGYSASVSRQTTTRLWEETVGDSDAREDSNFD